MKVADSLNKYCYYYCISKNGIPTIEITMTYRSIVLKHASLDAIVSRECFLFLCISNYDITRYLVFQSYSHISIHLGFGCVGRYVICRIKHKEYQVVCCTFSISFYDNNPTYINSCPNGMKFGTLR